MLNEMIANKPATTTEVKALEEVKVEGSVKEQKTESKGKLRQELQNNYQDNEFV
jgi:hypothetical protein